MRWGSEIQKEESSLKVKLQDSPGQRYEKSKTKDFWQNGISGSEYIAKALEYCAIKYVEDLLDYAELDKYIDVVSKTNEFLVTNVIPDFISLSDLRFIFTSLIREEISIKDITYIFEKINDFAEDSTKSDLIKKIRLTLSRQICDKYKNEDGIISAFEIYILKSRFQLHLVLLT